jgi:hypothetical protein
MNDLRFLGGSFLCLAILAAFAAGIWAIFDSVQAIVRKEFRRTRSGEILTGSKAVRAGLIRVVVFTVGLIIIAIGLLNTLLSLL